MTQRHDLTCFVELEPFTRFLRDFIRDALAKAYCPENPERVSVDVKCVTTEGYDGWYTVQVIEYEPMKIEVGDISDARIPRARQREFTFRANADGKLIYFEIRIAAYTEPETVRLMAKSAEQLLRATGLNAIVTYDW